MEELTAFEFCKILRDEWHALPLSKEQSGKTLRSVSNKELKRWFQAGYIQANGEKLEADELMDFALSSFILFPGSKSQCTLYWG